MGMVQERKRCVSCGKMTLHGREQFSGSIGCIATLLTGFFFLPIWLLINIVESFRPMRCQVCGLPYSRSAVNAEFRERRMAVTKAEGRFTTAPASPPFDWVGLARGIGRIPVSAISGLTIISKAAARDIARGYRSLPEWATPIVWGLGITSPVLVGATIGHLLAWW